MIRKTKDIDIKRHQKTREKDEKLETMDLQNNEKIINEWK